MGNFKKAKIYGKFYSPEKILSYGRPLSISVGSRSIGKTTGFGMHFLKDFLESGHRFIYLRRTEDEISKTAPSAFDSAAKILCGYYEYADFKYDHGNYAIKIHEDDDWTTCGTALALSTEDKLKSSDFSSVFWLWYEEFVCLDSTRYLGSQKSPIREYEKLMELYQTVDRGIGKAFRNEARIVLTGNNLSYFNPIYTALGITNYIRTDSKYIAPKNALWVLEQTAEVEATKDIQQSWAFKLSPEAMQQSAYANIASGSDRTFVEKVTAPMEFCFNVAFSGKKYGVYFVKSKSILYVSKPGAGETIALSPGDQSAHSILYLSAPCKASVGLMKRMYSDGCMRFATIDARYAIQNFLRLTP